MKDVSLNVYDISNGYAKLLAKPILGLAFEGVYHTGIVFGGMEYFFGAGILCDLPEETPFGIPEKRLDLGKTNISTTQFQQFLSDIEDHFQMEHYHYLKYNCNVFTNRVAIYLTGNGIPTDILLQPQLFLNCTVIKNITRSYKAVKNSLRFSVVSLKQVAVLCSRSLRKLNFPMSAFIKNARILNLEKNLKSGLISYSEFVQRKNVIESSDIELPSKPSFDDA